MTDRNPIPYCLSHLTQRDAAVRARALEDAARDIKALTIQSSFNDWDDGYNAALKTAASDVLSLIPTPPAPAPDEAKSRVIGSVIDGTNAQAGVHQVTTHETGGVTDPIPGVDEAAIRAELLAAARGYVDGWDDCENTSDDKLSTLLIVLRAAIARAALARATS